MRKGLQPEKEKIMARGRKVGKKRVSHRKAHKGGTKVLPAHMLGKSLHKKVGRKRSRKG